MYTKQLCGWGGFSGINSYILRYNFTHLQLIRLRFGLVLSNLQVTVKRLQVGLGRYQFVIN